MSSKNVTPDVVQADEQIFKKVDGVTVDEGGFEIVDETPAFRPTVEQEVQANLHTIWWKIFVHEACCVSRSNLRDIRRFE